MRSSVIVFPGSNCDRDIAVALEKMQFKNKMVWHKETSLPKTDLIVIPGGFSYGDYLRSGAIAGKSVIINEVIKAANDGCLVLGICNGFQILTETGLLNGTLLRNKNLKFINRDVNIKVINNKTKFSSKYKLSQILKINIAHNEGNFFTDTRHLEELKKDNLIAFKYCDKNGEVNHRHNHDDRVFGIRDHHAKSFFICTSVRSRPSLHNKGSRGRRSRGRRTSRRCARLWRWRCGARRS